MTTKGGVPDYGIAFDYPQLWEKAQQFDFAERLGVDELAAAPLREIDRALRELWDSRREVAEDPLRVFRFALAEDRGAVIVALSELSDQELGAVIDAAQLVDEEGQSRDEGWGA